MLHQQTLDLLHTLRLTGMAQALAEQAGVPDLGHLSFDERFALLLEREKGAREQRRLTRLLQLARFRVPASVEDINFRVKRGLDRATISVHCHDDLGLAVANSLAAIKAGARQVECCVNGVGERAGNAAIEELVMSLTVRRDHHRVDHGINIQELMPTSALLQQFTGIVVQPNKAVVGANAFAHESGIHQHGMMANPLAYEIMTPESVGAGHTKLVLGKHSGRRALADRLEKLGHPLDRNQVDEVYTRFTALADRKKSIYDQDLLGLLQPGKSIPIATA